MVISHCGCIRCNWCVFLSGVFVTISIAHRDPDHGDGTVVQLEAPSDLEGGPTKSHSYPKPSSWSSMPSGFAELNETSGSGKYFNKVWIRSLAQLTHIIVDYLPKDVFWESFHKPPKEFTTDMILYVLHAQDGDRYRRLVDLTPRQFKDFRKQKVAREKIVGEEGRHSEFDKTLLRMVNDIYPHEVTPEKLTSAWFATDLHRIEKMIEIARDDWFANCKDRTLLPGDSRETAFDAELDMHPVPVGVPVIGNGSSRRDDAELEDDLESVSGREEDEFEDDLESVSGRGKDAFEDDFFDDE